MNPRLLIAAAFAALALSANAEVRIGVINMERVMRESEPAKKASSKLEKEFKKRSLDLEKAHQQLQAMQEDVEKNGAAMTDAVRATKSKELNGLTVEVQRKQREYNEDLNARRNEELQAFNERTTSVIRAMAEKENYDLIILQEAVLYSGKSVDITPNVIKALSEAPAK